MKTNTPFMVRQGDVLLIQMTDSQFKTDGYTASNSRTVALGEVTGHHHTFDSDATVYIDDETSSLAVNAQGMLVDVQADTILRHQEHGPIAVPAGKYRRVIQREYSPEEIRNVAD